MIRPVFFFVPRQGALTWGLRSPERLMKGSARLMKSLKALLAGQAAATGSELEPCRKGESDDAAALEAGPQPVTFRRLELAARLANGKYTS